MMQHYKDTANTITVDAIPLEMNTIPNLKPTWLDNNKQLMPTLSLCNNNNQLFSTPHNSKT